MQYKRLFKYDPQCWMPSVEGHVICGHTDFVTSFLYFDTKSWTLIAYCALMLSIVQITTLIISKKPGNTGISRDIRTEFTTDLLLSD